MNRLNKILILIFIYNIFIFPQRNAAELKSGIDSLLTAPFFQSTQAAIEIYDLTAHHLLYKKNEKLLLTPASNMKILTTAAALFYLGHDYQFQTSVCYTGNILNRILYGDLYLIGGGDPLFNMQNLDSLINEIDETGLKEITGNIYADVSWKDSLIWGDGWMWDDDPSTDAPYLSALNINDNSIEVFVSPTKTGEKANIYLDPQTGYVNVINNTVTTPFSGSNKYKITRDWIDKENTIIVEGPVRNRTIIDSEKVWKGVNIFNPAMYFTTLFYESLIESGIKVSGIPGEKTAPEYVYQLSRYQNTIDSVIVNVNKTSDNLGAEMILYALAEKYFGKPATAQNGCKIINCLIDTLGLKSDNYRIADGSGVSRYNLISAELLIEVLKYLFESKPEIFQKFYNSLPVAGVDGTLKDRMQNTLCQNNVHAKTGTMSGVSSLSGYITSKNYHTLAFSIIFQNYVGDSSEARNFQDIICEMLAGFQ